MLTNMKDFNSTTHFTSQGAGKKKKKKKNKKNPKLAEGRK